MHTMQPHDIPHFQAYIPVTVKATTSTLAAEVPMPTTPAASGKQANIQLVLLQPRIAMQTQMSRPPTCCCPFAPMEKCLLFETLANSITCFHCCMVEVLALCYRRLQVLKQAPLLLPTSPCLPPLLGLCVPKLISQRYLLKLKGLLPSQRQLVAFVWQLLVDSSPTDPPTHAWGIPYGWTSSCIHKMDQALCPRRVSSLLPCSMLAVSARTTAPTLMAWAGAAGPMEMMKGWDDNQTTRIQLGPIKYDQRLRFCQDSAPNQHADVHQRLLLLLLLSLLLLMLRPPHRCYLFSLVAALTYNLLTTRGEQSAATARTHSKTATGQTGSYAGLHILECKGISMPEANTLAQQEQNLDG